jgi:hypothetical protein
LIEINFSPTHFNIREIGAAVDLAYELGAYSFYTGRTMHTGNAVKTWRIVASSEEEYAEFFDVLHAKADECGGRMRVHFHEMGLLEELRYRLHHPAALLIVLLNGVVKLINALPFVSRGLRTQSLAEIWSNFCKTWQRARCALHRRPGGRSVRYVGSAQVGARLARFRAYGWMRLRRRSVCCVSSAWSGIVSSSTPGSCLASSAPHGPMRSPACSMPRFS